MRKLSLFIYLLSDVRDVHSTLYLPLPPVEIGVNDTEENTFLTDNLELSTGIHGSVLVLCNTLIHPRVQQTNPGYCQSPSVHMNPPLQTNPLD